MSDEKTPEHTVLEQANYTPEQIEEAKRQGKRLEYYLNKPRTSTHIFSDGTREGILTAGAADIPIVELIRKHMGDELADKVLSMPLPRAETTDVQFIVNSFRYYHCSATAVLHEYKKPEQTCLLDNVDAMLDAPYSPVNWALHLTLTCKECEVAFNDIVKKEKHSLKQLTDVSILLLTASQQYHKMLVSLIERKAIGRLKQGAEERQAERRNNTQRKDALRFAEGYIQGFKGRNTQPSQRGVCKRVKEKFAESGLGNAPSRNTLVRWLREEGIPI